jgi:hypothetical protein
VCPGGGGFVFVDVDGVGVGVDVDGVGEGKPVVTENVGFGVLLVDGGAVVGGGT